MSEVTVADPVWQAILADPELARARRKLSFHEIRLIVRHAQAEKPKQDKLRQKRKMLTDCGFTVPSGADEATMDRMIADFTSNA